MLMQYATWQKMKQSKLWCCASNSPGGSAFASEVMLRELQHLSQQKPLIMSLGSVAASEDTGSPQLGKQFSQNPTRLQDRLEYLDLIPNIKQFAANWNVAFDGVNTNTYSDINSLARRKTPHGNGIHPKTSRLDLHAIFSESGGIARNVSGRSS